MLRRITEAIDHGAETETCAEIDTLLREVAQQFSVQVRTEFAKLIASNVVSFCESARYFANDQIAVASAILKWSDELPESDVLSVIEQRSQEHLLLISKSRSVSPNVSNALLQKGDETVVCALLENKGANITDEGYELAAQRAENSQKLQRSLVKRPGVPLGVLHDLYLKVERELRQQILDTFGNVPLEELDKAFARSRAKITRSYRKLPDDFAQANKRLEALRKAGRYGPSCLTGLLREGSAGRTVFKLALASLCGIEYEIVDQAVETPDADTLALLCRAGGVDRASFMTIALGLDKSERGMLNAEKFGQLYDDVPVEAAQRAVRFWKVRHC
ncbi:MAG: DUF2336 domain-containing protein [Rhizomicrobium sp.]